MLGFDFVTDEDCKGHIGTLDLGSSMQNGKYGLQWASWMGLTQHCCQCKCLGETARLESMAFWKHALEVAEGSVGGTDGGVRRNK